MEADLGDVLTDLLDAGHLDHLAIDLIALSLQLVSHHRGGDGAVETAGRGGLGGELHLGTAQLVGTLLCLSLEGLKLTSLLPEVLLVYTECALGSEHSHTLRD